MYTVFFFGLLVALLFIPSTTVIADVDDAKNEPFVSAEEPPYGSALKNANSDRPVAQCHASDVLCQLEGTRWEGITWYHSGDGSRLKSAEIRFIIFDRGGRARVQSTSPRYNCGNGGQICHYFYEVTPTDDLVYKGQGWVELRKPDSQWWLFLRKTATGELTGNYREGEHVWGPKISLKQQK